MGNCIGNKNTMTTYQAILWLNELRSSYKAKYMSDAKEASEATEMAIETLHKIKEYEKRLEISPYGDDKIDELESCIGFLRTRIEELEGKSKNDY